ncbi:MAG: outer membrane lipoprotein carrier protein LolA [Sandaracinaceae bacterium]|nr:outer membrane lipoprotein carrier protein LolA [Sandaracinaceae bacterium]
MKTTTMTLALCSAFAIAALPASGAMAQSEPQPVTAAHVAARVQSFYDQTRTIRTAFTQRHYDRTYQRTTRSRGVLTIARPGKLRFDYLGGDGKVVVSDGRELTVYEPGDDGGPGQYARSTMREDASSALGFLTGQARLDRDFRFRLVDAARFPLGRPRPRADAPPAGAGYRRAYLFVDSSAGASGVVRRVIIQDHAGNVNQLDFARMQFNREVSASRFRFVPPRGARRI